jgi:hypothetical protein
MHQRKKVTGYTIASLSRTYGMKVHNRSAEAKG